MSIEFTHVPAFTQQRHENLDNSGARQTLALIEHAGFGRIVIDSPAGLLANVDVAAEAARRTSSLGLVLTHWAGVIVPVIAARQLAEVDRLSEGRLSLRMVAGFDGAADDEPGSSKDHFGALQQMDEYLTLLKRLWSNDRPFDHEGRFYSVRNGYVARKGPQGGGIQIRMGGVSGTALKIAGRHADIFEVLPGPLRTSSTWFTGCVWPQPSMAVRARSASPYRSASMRPNRKRERGTLWRNRMVHTVASASPARRSRSLSPC
jgi:alkanesulfonate monooxygenase